MFEHGKMVRGERLEVLEERMKMMDPDRWDQNQESLGQVKGEVNIQ